MEKEFFRARTIGLPIMSEAKNEPTIYRLWRDESRLHEEFEKGKDRLIFLALLGNIGGLAYILGFAENWLVTNPNLLIIFLLPTVMFAMGAALCALGVHGAVVIKGAKANAVIRAIKRLNDKEEEPDSALDFDAEYKKEIARIDLEGGWFRRMQSMAWDLGVKCFPTALALLLALYIFATPGVGSTIMTGGTKTSTEVGSISKNGVNIDGSDNQSAPSVDE